MFGTFSVNEPNNNNIYTLIQPSRVHRHAGILIKFRPALTVELTKDKGFKRTNKVNNEFIFGYRILEILKVHCC